MSKIDILYSGCFLGTQTLAPTLTGFQGLKCCAQYLASHPRKIIFHSYNSYDGSNIIILTWRGNKVEEYTTKNSLECHKCVDWSILINRRRSVSGIIHTLIDDAVCLKVQVQQDIASESTDVEIRCVYNSVNKANAIRCYMASLALQTVAPTVHW